MSSSSSWLFPLPGLSSPPCFKLLQQESYLSLPGPHPDDTASSQSIPVHVALSRPRTDQQLHVRGPCVSSSLPPVRRCARLGVHSSSLPSCWRPPWALGAWGQGSHKHPSLTVSRGGGGVGEGTPSSPWPWEVVWMFSGSDVSVTSQTVRLGWGDLRVTPSKLISIHLQSVMVMYPLLDWKPEYICSHLLLTSFRRDLE